MKVSISAELRVVNANDSGLQNHLAQTNRLGKKKEKGLSGKKWRNLSTKDLTLELPSSAASEVSGISVIFALYFRGLYHSRTSRAVTITISHVYDSQSVAHEQGDQRP